MPQDVPAGPAEQGAVTAIQQAAPRIEPGAAKPKQLPPYKVILHNDDVNTFEHVIVTIVQLTALNENDAIQRAVEAHNSGCALLLVTHKERAELYEDQFRSASLTVTIEPAE
ncbi:MAG: ATP-dependent Clp protease adaptor ClpS [Phycisphaerae bacterium]|nr:ATP-dependent Clp protease adaptor ClpS [Phycisphaerae bacterium]